MIVSIQKRCASLPHKILSAFIAFTFVFSLVFPPGYAQLIPASPAGGPQTLLNLPAPGTMVSVSPAFTPALINGITIHPENPLEFDFIVGTGDEKLQGKAFEDESTKLIKYFLASLTVPEDEMWVNLSPYEKDRIIPTWFGTTEMGRDLLAQDYILKQLTASLMYPEKELGSEFWKKIYQKAYEQYGTTEIPMNTFNKVWIVPQKAVVYEHGNSAFVVKSHLKVMLEEDYVAMSQGIGDRVQGIGEKLTPKPQTQNPQVSTEIIREVILPEIEKEVNEGKGFANLRQIYNSAILAAWYKQKLTVGAENLQPLLWKVYVDQNKTKGVDVDDKTVNEKIYARYLEAFKKGVYNYIKEDYDPATKEVIPRKYFSGGTNLKVGNLVETYKNKQPLAREQQEILGEYLAGLKEYNQGMVSVNLVELSEDMSVAAAQELIASSQRATKKSSSPVQRAEEIKGLLAEIDKELADPGTGNLPEVAVMSDFHGGLSRFIMLLSDVLNEFSGFQGQLDPNRTIGGQLAAQGLSFKDIKGQIILGGDILDRGKHGIKIFLFIKELVEKGEGKVVYVTGNHDFWAFANLLGMHLPWYKGFHFYGDTEAENRIARYRQTNPELFDTPESILWWTERLAEHNADQDAYQKKAFNGKVKEVRARFIEDYKTHQKNWDDAQKDAMEKFIGYFARIGVADPYVGLNGLGKASASWWKQVARQLNQGYEARRSLGAEDAELSVGRRRWP